MKSLILALLISMSAFANAQWNKIPSTDFRVSAPPREGSRIYNQDFATLLEYQETRTSEQCELARSQKWPTFSVMFNEPSVLRTTDFDKSRALMERVSRFAVRVSSYFKDQYERPRPYDTNPDIRPCVPRVQGSTAYPSSHATAAAAMACVLAEAYPRKAEQILAYGQELGDLRAVIGVHHPSDVKAGQKLGRDVCARLLTEEDFQEELEAIR